MTTAEIDAALRRLRERYDVAHAQARELMALVHAVRLSSLLADPDALDRALSPCGACEAIEGWMDRTSARLAAPGVHATEVDVANVEVAVVHYETPIAKALAFVRLLASSPGMRLDASTSKPTTGDA